MANGVTNISELPVSNSTGPPPNVTLHASEKNSNEANMQKLAEQRSLEDAQNSKDRVPPPNPNDYMKQVISDVNNVSKNGGLRLPDRDIPREQHPVANDIESKVDYIPNEPVDYIKNYQTAEQINHVHTQKQQKVEQCDYIYDELQTPLLISVIYFVMQLPAVHKIILKNIPGLFKNDGNLNIQGYLFNSILFGSVYYLIAKGLKYISE
tara:strand:+ start:1469 stop:2095 length:627 start_codon:yes stop_codon:yes gene_type:complete